MNSGSGEQRNSKVVVLPEPGSPQDEQQTRRIKDAGDVVILQEEFAALGSITQRHASTIIDFGVGVLRSHRGNFIGEILLGDKELRRRLRNFLAFQSSRHSNKSVPRRLGVLV